MIYYILLFAIFLFPSFSYAITIDEVLKNMEIAQDKLISMNTNILEEISVQGIPEKQILEGRFILKKPDKMYVEFTKPTSQIIVSNGKTIWMYARELNQVVKQEISDKSGKLPYFMEFERSFKVIADNFNTQFIREEKVNGKDTCVIEFIPKQNAVGDFKMVSWISKELWLPVQIKITDTNSSELLVIFKDIQLNKTIDSSVFEFKIPQGVEVVEAKLFE